MSMDNFIGGNPDTVQYPAVVAARDSLLATCAMLEQLEVFRNTNPGISVADSISNNTLPTKGGERGIS